MLYVKKYGYFFDLEKLYYFKTIQDVFFNWKRYIPCFVETLHAFFINCSAKGTFKNRNGQVGLSQIFIKRLTMMFFVPCLTSQ